MVKGDILDVEGKECVVVKAIDELIQVKYTEKAEAFLEERKYHPEKQMTIQDKEKIREWIETDNEKLEIIKLNKSEY